VSKEKSLVELISDLAVEDSDDCCEEVPKVCMLFERKAVVDESRFFGRRVLPAPSWSFLATEPSKWRSSGNLKGNNVVLYLLKMIKMIKM